MTYFELQNRGLAIVTSFLVSVATPVQNTLLQTLAVTMIIAGIVAAICLLIEGLHEIRNSKKEP